MRVLLVVHGFPPHAQGGAEIYAEQQALALARGGDEVVVLTREQDHTRPDYAVRTEDRAGLRLTWVNNTFRDVRTVEESYRSAPIAAVAARLIDEVRPEVAHVHHLTCLSTEIPALLASRGVPVVMTLHDYWLLCHRGQLLDVHGRVCAGPEPSGCGACLGVAAAPVPPVLVPALRAAERALPRAVSAGARELAGRVLTAASSEPEGKGEGPAFRRLEDMRRVCTHVAGFFAPSRAMRDRFVRFGVPEDRIEVWPYGFEGRRQGRGEGRPEGRPLRTDGVGRDGGGAGGVRLGFLGTLMVSKAPHLLLEAHRRLPQGTASVEIYGALAAYHGDDSYRARLEPLLTGPGVYYHGPQPHARIPEVLASLDALVVTSVWPETSPLVIREAFLAGVPVVASRLGGIPEAVEHERNGLLFEPGSVDDLERTLARLTGEPGLLDRLKAGAAGTEVRTLEDDVRATRALYGKLVTGRAGRSWPLRVRPRLAAVVLHYGSQEDTALAVGSLRASDRMVDDLIVVDNEEGAGCRDGLRRFGDAVTYVRNGRNLGFSGGMNVGVRLALERGADRVLLVNSDVVVPPDCLGRLEEALTGDQPAGIAGPLVLSRSWPDLVASAGIDYDLATGRMRQRATGLRAETWRHTGDHDGHVDAVNGCLMLVGREVFERIGLFDERYFFSFEEIEFCLRARAAGFRPRVVTQARAYHEGGRSIGAASPSRLYYAARNHLLLASEHGAGGLARIGRGTWVGALNLAHAARAPGGSVFARVGATLSGIRDHVRGEYGPQQG